MSIENLVYVGTYTEPILGGDGRLLEGQAKGIYRFRFDPKSGGLTPHGVTEGVRNPSFLCLDRKRQTLYCVNEMKEWEGQFGGGLSAYRIDQETGALTFLNAMPSRGTDPCHIIVELSGQFVYVANYSSGSVIGYRIAADGSLGDEVAFIAHEGHGADPERQAGPHCHWVTFDTAGRFAYVCDLGLDKIVQYALDPATGALTRVSETATAPGAGPRVLVLHPSGDFAYAINELNSTVAAYRRDPATGALTELQSLSTLPADFSGDNSGAALQITPNGKLLIASNRGHDSLAIFAVDGATGWLTARGHQPSGGERPRHFAISPDGGTVLAANQDTGTIVPLRLDRVSGQMTAVDDPISIPTPICVMFA